jgi:hypothetical protein
MSTRKTLGILTGKKSVVLRKREVSFINIICKITIKHIPTLLPHHCPLAVLPAMRRWVLAKWERKNKEEPQN